MSNTPLNATRLGPTFACRVDDFDISEDSLQTSSRAIYETFLEHGAVVFRRQDITPSVFSKFGEVFGLPEVHHLRQLRHPEQPTLSLLSNQPEPGRRAESRTSGQGWHSDYSYKLRPGSATMLHGIEIPESGGDTLFADSQAAFLDLPADRKRQLRALRAIHHYRWSTDRTDPWARWTYIGEQERRETPPVSHPLVRVHPDTGVESLFIQPFIVGSVRGIEGMTLDDSVGLIDELIAHITQDQYVYRHQWKPLDVVVWDNRRLLHSATTKDLDPSIPRRLLRLTTHGQPVTPADPAVGYTRLLPADDDEV